MIAITPKKRLKFGVRILDIESVIDVKRLVAAGMLRDRVIVQQQVAGQDDFGAPISTWDNEATVWAYVEPLRGNELFAAQQVQGAADIRVTMRGRGNETREVYCKEAQ